MVFFLFKKKAQPYFILGVGSFPPGRGVFKLDRGNLIWGLHAADLH